MTENDRGKLTDYAQAGSELTRKPQKNVVADCKARPSSGEEAEALSAWVESSSAGRLIDRTQARQAAYHSR